MFMTANNYVNFINHYITAAFLSSNRDNIQIIWIVIKSVKNVDNFRLLLTKIYTAGQSLQAVTLLLRPFEILANS